jgi:hypothetical protein
MTVRVKNAKLPPFWRRSLPISVVDFGAQIQMICARPPCVAGRVSRRLVVAASCMCSGPGRSHDEIALIA